MGGSITAPLVEAAGRSGQRVCHFGSALWGSVCVRAVGAVGSGRRRAGSAALCDTAAAAAGSRRRVCQVCGPGWRGRVCAAPGAARSEQPAASSPVPGHRCRQQQPPACWAAPSSFVLSGLFWATGASCWLSSETVPSFCKRQQDKRFKLM